MKSMPKKKVLVIAPHMDDEVLGCGGVILKHKAEGHNVSVIFIAHRAYCHLYDKKMNDMQKAHARKAMKALSYDRSVFFDLPDERLDASVQDIIIPMEKIVNEIKPEIVYLPSRGDNNQDHRAVFDAARVAIRPSSASFISSVYMYEVPSSTEQSPPLPENAFLPNYYIDIEDYFEKKLKAYRCYETESRKPPHPRSEEALKVLAKKRGHEIGFSYAEAFMVLREKWS